MRKWELSVNSSACLCSGQYGLTVETMHLVSAGLLSVTEQPHRRAAEKSVILLTIKYRISVSVVRHSHICLATKYSAVIQLDRQKPKIYIILFMFHVKWNESEMNERTIFSSIHRRRRLFGKCQMSYDRQIRLLLCALLECFSFVDVIYELCTKFTRPIY